jgi:hypothetical protein
VSLMQQSPTQTANKFGHYCYACLFFFLGSLTLCSLLKLSLTWYISQYATLEDPISLPFFHTLVFCGYNFLAFHLSQLPPFLCIVMLFLIFINSHIIQQIFHCLKMECRMGILNKNSTHVYAILTNGKTGIPRSWLWRKSIRDDISSPSNSNLDSFHSKMHCTCFVEMQLIC